MGSTADDTDPRDMEGYDEALERFLTSLTAAQRLAGLSRQQILATLSPEQRLAGLDRDHQALALPLEVLRLLPESYLRSLSPDVEAELRRRLATPGG